MKQRLITSAFILAATVPILIFSQYIIYPIVLSILAVGGVFEALRVLGTERAWFISVPAYLIAAALPIGLYLGREYLVESLLACAFIILAYLVYLFAFAVVERGELKLSTVAQVFAWVTYIVSSFTAATLIRYINGGIYCVALIFIASWICDVFAYITGSLFGRHKLIPEVSPKKTVEGSVGGIVFATAAFVLYGFLVAHFFDVTANYPILAVSGLLLSVVSQIGDLVASLLKREHGVKDYGKVFPGHGGVLDRFDSVMAVSCMLMIICIAVPPFS